MEELQTSETLDKNMQQKIEQKLKTYRIKDMGYKELLIEKRNIIKETMEKCKIHREFRLGKMQQQNEILREQMKIVESKIYEAGMVRTRMKRSISGQKSSEMSKKLLQRPIPQRKIPHA